MRRLALAAGVLVGFALTIYALATYGERACDRLEASGPVPAAIAFKEPEQPMVHVPDWRLFDEATRSVACLRCHAMVNVKQWAGETCPGEPAKENA